MFLIYVVTFVSCGRGISYKIKDYKNDLTEEHINIPATRCYLVPPKGFEASANFTGYRKGTGSSLYVLEKWGSSFYDDSATYCKERAALNGETIIDYRELKAAGYPAILLHTRINGGKEVYTLFFGDSTFSVLLLGMYPAREDSTGDAVAASLETIYYDENKLINPYDHIYFTIDESQSDFKLLQFPSRICIYTLGGGPIKESSSYAIAAEFPGSDGDLSGEEIFEIMNMVLQRFSGVKLEKPHQLKVKTKMINGNPAYEVELKAQLENTGVITYGLQVQKEDKSVLFLGINKSGISLNTEDFKKLAYTIQIK